MKRILSLVLTGLLAVACVSFACGADAPAPPQKKSDPTRPTEKVAVLGVDALIAGVDAYAGSRVSVEGVVVHVCPVDGKKMKLKGDGGGTVHVENSRPEERYDAALKDKRVVVTGLVSEKRIDEAYIAGLEKEFAKELGAVCHVDKTRCKGKPDLAEEEKREKARKAFAEKMAALRQQVKESGKGYISVVTVQSDNVEVAAPAAAR